MNLCEPLSLRAFVAAVDSSRLPFLGSHSMDWLNLIIIPTIRSLVLIVVLLTGFACT